MCGNNTQEKNIINKWEALMKKKLISAIMIATLAVSFTACGSTTESTSESSSGKSVEELGADRRLAAAVR
jgi:hypothetical protein